MRRGKPGGSWQVHTPLFEVSPILEHDHAVELEAGLRTVPGDELANGVVVGPLAAGGRQAVQHGRLGMFVQERQDALWRPLLARFRFGISNGLLHRRRQPRRTSFLRGNGMVCPSFSQNGGE
jgi:hypothetical protein